MKQRNFLPGLSVVGLIAAVVTTIFPDGFGFLSSTVLVLLIGLGIRNLWMLPQDWRLGVDYCVKSMLKLAIILLGVRFSFQEIFTLGSRGLLLILGGIVIAGLITYLVGSRLGVSPTLATLIGVGTAICGNTAIMATGPILQADDEEISVAVAAITLFGTIAVFLYPLIGSILSFGDRLFGFWAGTAIHDTSQVVAAGFAFSAEAGEVATLVKMTRNLFLGPIVFLIGVVFSHRKGRADKVPVGNVFPWFVVGFLLLALFNSFRLVPTGLIPWIQGLSSFIIHMVLAGVGLKTDLRSITKIGGAAFALGLIVALSVAAYSLVVLHFWF